MTGRSTMYDLQPGYPVFTVDGDELGRVKEVRDGAFKIDAPWQADYWLPIDMVMSVIPGERVTVDVAGENLDERKMDRPDMGPEEYRQRYRQNRGYSAGMDFDPERDVYRDPRRRDYGGAWDFGPDPNEFRGGAAERGEAYLRNRGDYSAYPERDMDRQGQWDRERRRQFSDEGPWQRERTTNQWGQQYRGYTGDQVRGERQWWYNDRDMPPTQGPRAYQRGGVGSPDYDREDYSDYDRGEGRDYDFVGDRYDYRGGGDQVIGGQRQGGGSYRYGSQPVERRRDLFQPGSSVTERYQRGGRQSFAGRGPKNYQRNDDRICEDVCETLAQHPDIDPKDIEVSVEQGEVVLKGTVETRFDKRAAEDIAAEVSGVKDVRNELKVQTMMMTGADKPATGW